MLATLARCNIQTRRAHKARATCAARRAVTRPHPWRKRTSPAAPRPCPRPPQPHSRARAAPAPACVRARGARAARAAAPTPRQRPPRQRRPSRGGRRCRCERTCAAEAALAEARCMPPSRKRGWTPSAPLSLCRPAVHHPHHRATTPCARKRKHRLDGPPHAVGYDCWPARIPLSAVSSVEGRGRRSAAARLFSQVVGGWVVTSRARAPSAVGRGVAPWWFGASPAPL